jgi:hypothetical protein
MPKQNNPDTLSRAQQQIDQIASAKSREGVGLYTTAARSWLLALYYRYAVASGWLSAPQLEGLVSSRRKQFKTPSNLY